MSIFLFTFIVSFGIGYLILCTTLVIKATNRTKFREIVLGANNPFYLLFNMLQGFVLFVFLIMFAMVSLPVILIQHLTHVKGDGNNV